MTSRIERRPNPRSNREYSQAELDQMAASSLAHQAELEESYLEARLERVERQAQEQEEWREEHRNARVQEWAERTGRSVVDYPYGGFIRL